MNDHDQSSSDTAPVRPAWNKGKIIGPRPPLRPGARMVDPCQVASGAAPTRLGALQPRDRQARLSTFKDPTAAWQFFSGLEKAGLPRN